MKKNLFNYEDFITDNIDNTSFIYVYLDPRKSGDYKYGEYEFNHEPFYVGASSGKTIHDRKVRHLQYAKNDKDITNNNYKKNIIKSILSDKLEPIILKYIDGMSISDAFFKEKDMILIIGNRYDKSGPLVNISKGGDGGDNFTNNPRKEEIREKHRRNALGSNNNMYGLPLEEYPSHKAKLRGEHWNMGRTASISTREKLSKQRSGSGNSRAKKTLLFDKDFNIIREFDYCFDVSNYINSSNRSVSKTASTNSKEEMYPYHTTKGYYIIYKDDWENKFKNKENEIREYLKTFKKNKNQFS
jgi:hypothetical protein